MWIVKGAFLGVWLFGFGTMAFLYFAIYRNLPPHSAVAVTVVTGYTSQNPLWWAAAAVCLVLGLAIARSWSGPLALWIALLATGLIPAAWLTLFLVLAYKLKHHTQGH
jgi:hypothetical protein